MTHDDCTSMLGKAKRARTSKSGKDLPKDVRDAIAAACPKPEHFERTERAKSVLSYVCETHEQRMADYEQRLARYGGDETLAGRPPKSMTPVWELPMRDWEKTPFLKEIVLSYLRRQDFIEWYCPSIEYDAFDLHAAGVTRHDRSAHEKARISGAGHVMVDEDARWRWSDGLPYYVDMYDLDLPDEFVAFVLDYYIDLLRPAAESVRREKETGTKEEDVTVRVAPAFDSFSANGMTSKGGNIFGEKYVAQKEQQHRAAYEERANLYRRMIENFDELVAMRDGIDVESSYDSESASE